MSARSGLKLGRAFFDQISTTPILKCLMTTGNVYCASCGASPDASPSVTGALELSNRDLEKPSPGIFFSQGIREHVCDVLEGGEEAFREGEERYGFSTGGRH